MTESLPISPANLPAEQRASDADRDGIASVLGQALATGRLTTEEHATRLEAAYSAKTMGELAPLVRDLPAETAGSAGIAESSARNQVTARFSKVHRGGRWVAGRYTTLNSVFGTLIVNLCEAVLPGREITLELNALFGKLIVVVPNGARLVDEGAVLFGKRVVSGSRAPDEGDGGPVIRVIGNARFSKVIVRRQSDGWFGYF